MSLQQHRWRGERLKAPVLLELGIWVLRPICLCGGTQLAPFLLELGYDDETFFCTEDAALRWEFGTRLVYRILVGSRRSPFCLGSELFSVYLALSRK